MLGTLPRRSAAWPRRVQWLAGLAATWLLCAACTGRNAALALPKAGGPIPISQPREPTAAERAYWDKLAPARVIYIGETHNNNADHAYQLEVLKGLRTRGANLTVAWEMFDLTQQELLDAWDARRLSTESLLEKTDFQPHWGRFSVLYEKILRWSLAEGVPSLALNAPASLSRKLAENRPLDDRERALLPTGYRPLPGGYEHFTEQMGPNPHAGANLANFYQAQLLWDQTMATRIVDYLAAHPERKLVVLVGRGHVDGGYGVPAFVSQKTDAPQLLVYPDSDPERNPAGGRVARRGPSVRPLAPARTLAFSPVPDAR